MIHEQLDLDKWLAGFSLAGMNTDTDVASVLTGPLPVAYVEQVRSRVKKTGGRLGTPVPVDLCVWKLGDAKQRYVTKIGGVPYWPANEPWPTFGRSKPYTFLAQFCFMDSRDILPRLPGDILAVLAADSDYQDIELRWFPFGINKLLRPEELPAPRWPITPCHAVLHRTAEYPEAEFRLFEAYPYPLSHWARAFRECSKIGGVWYPRGELPDPAEFEDTEIRRQIEEAWETVERWERSFLCQLGSILATRRQPFVNVSGPNCLTSRDDDHLLMIMDVGGYDFFHHGDTTEYSCWSG